MATILEKEQRLRKYKFFATGLFLLMAGIFTGTYFIDRGGVLTGYVRAFSEAAMVGALADWFAVTALFRHPLGLPIPHTNLIQSNQSAIGQNLGDFIAENFLTGSNIRPRIREIKISEKVGDWILQPQNKKILIQGLVRIGREALQQVNEEEIVQLIYTKGSGLITGLNGGKLGGSLLNGILDRGLQETWITVLAQNIENYITTHPELIEEKVRAESHILIPDFVDDYIAGKITKGLKNFLSGIIKNPNHPQRKNINRRLRQLASDMEHLPEWQDRLEGLKQNLLPEFRIKEYSIQLWSYLKTYISDNLEKKDSGLSNYLDKLLTELATGYLKTPEKSAAIDRFVQFQLFKLILAHRGKVAELISSTVKGWDSRELSSKFELEVGKDLQFIRFNGTIVGGIVGLIIYALSRLL